MIMLCVNDVEHWYEVPGLVTFDGCTYYRRKFCGVVKYYDEMSRSKALSPVVIGEVHSLFNARENGLYVFEPTHGMGDFFGSPKADSIEELLHELGKREDSAVLGYALNVSRLC